MLAEAQWAQIFGAAKKRGARWPDISDVEAFKREIEGALEATGAKPDRIDLSRFFDQIRGSKLLGPTLSQDEVDGCIAILEVCQDWPVSWKAYALATAYHETAGTMLPVKEYGGEAYFRRMYDKEGGRPEVAKRLGNTVAGDGVRFAGRGYVQLTGRANYARAEEELRVQFVSNPDLALQPAMAAAILERGMSEGWFTGKRLATYLPVSGPATLAQFKEARRIINGTDRAADIAGYAAEFQKGLME